MRRAVVALLVVGLLAVGAAAAFFVGLGPVPVGPDDGADGTPFPTGTVYDGGSGSGGTAVPTGSSTAPPFSFTVDAVEECGRTCRDVTVTLTNDQDEAATGVTAVTRLFAGQDNTESDDLVWRTEVDVGTLEAGRSYTTTERVDLSLREALAIEQRDGWVTVLTTVRSDERTVTFRDSLQAA